ncbi:MAG: ATP-dependent helicase [Candidatus Dormibacteraeota bacterium]|nr:ATP-dependent helicase [Candidatus Dormibacteraeota bacterium]MBO0760232.1 ATP-dependent helicase [Candidatus Dormibacteraeota bacterium]
MRALGLEQRAAARHLQGALCLVAGAGTGKTAVIAERFRLLVESGVDPASILVMTFTERAATEMRERIQTAAGCEAPNVGTFHSLALRWLRDDPRAGLPQGFRILRGPERWISLRELLWELGHPALVGEERPDDLVRPLLRLEERLKQELVPVERLRAWAGRQEDAERRARYLAAAQLFTAHAARCRRQGLADFDDLLLFAVRLLERHPEVRDHLRARYPWVMVDEYQDTNTAQERLVELLGAPDGNVCVVGDDDQSIYRFRGASRASMERFRSRFPEAVTLALGANRRSTGRVVEAARELIERNPGRLPKALTARPRARRGPPVEVWSCADVGAEAGAIAARVAALRREGVPARRVAVLTRTHAIAGPVLDAFAAAGIPFQHWATHGFYGRAEIRDLIAYLRAVHDPGDLHALVRLLTRPPLQLDPEEAMLHLRAGSEEDAPVAPLTSLRAWAPAAAWAETVAELVPLQAELGVDELLFEVLDRTRHVDAILPPAGAERQRVLAGVTRFGEIVSEYCERRRDHSLGRFLEHLALVLLSGMDEDVVAEELDDAVQVMSIHQAKGLEFDAVFVPAVVEGRLPQPHRSDDLELPTAVAEPETRTRANHVAEERRLLYVAMTRATGRLVLSAAARYEGGRRWRPSRFLAELDGQVEQRSIGEPTADEDEPAAAPAAPAPAGGEGPVLSFSAISAYRECPRQYWFRYQLRLPAPPTVEAQLGTAVHEALLRASRLRQSGRPLRLDTLRDLYRDSWDGLVLADERRRPALEALGWRLVHAFWEQGGLDEAPHLLEQPFVAGLPGWTLRGVIDRVDGDAEAGWRIVDYKTGRPLPASRLRRDLQLALYALGARRGLELDGARPVELQIVYLRDGQRVGVEADRELLEEAERIGGEVARGVASGRFEARPAARRCTLCPYRLACDAAL